MPEAVRTDEGKDYTSRHVLGVLADLEIEHRPCPPYTPEAKPFVERFLGTLTRDLFATLPGFTGHDVAQAQALRSRKSFAARRGEDDAVIYGATLTAQELQERCNVWCDAVYAGVSRPSPAPEGGTMAFRVSLARAAAYPVTVDYATAAGTATEGEDYRAARDTLTFAPGETEKTVEVPLLADMAAEGDETLTLRLSNARSSSPQQLSVDLSPDEAEGTIADGAGAAAEAVSPLTARFEGVPETHDGESAFRFRVAFSEDIGIGYRSLREDAFTVTGSRADGGWTTGATCSRSRSSRIRTKR